MSTRKQIALVFGAIGCICAAVVFLAPTLPKPKEILGPLLPEETSIVDDVITHTGKKSSSGEEDILQRSVRDDFLPTDRGEFALEDDFQAAKSAFDSQQFSKASKLFSDCLKEFPPTKMQSGNTRRVEILRNLAVCAYMSGDSKLFNDYFRKFVDCCDDSKRADYIVRLADVIGGFYARSNNIDAIKTCYRKFIDFDECNSYPSAKAKLLRILGDFERNSGHADASLKALNESFSIYQANKLTESDEYVALLISLGVTEFFTGNAELARYHLEEANRLVPDDEQVGVSLQENLMLIESIAVLTNLEFADFHFDKARKHAQRGLKLVKATYKRHPIPALAERAATFEKLLDNSDKAEKYFAANPELLKKEFLKRERLKKELLKNPKLLKKH